MAVGSESVLDRMTRKYGDRAYAHTTLVRHNGSAIALAMDEGRRLFYAVLGPPDAQANATANAATGPEWFDADGWPPAPRELEFPAELDQVGFGVVDPRVMPLVRRGDHRPQPAGTVRPLPGAPSTTVPIDRFLSTTARLSAQAPFQAISDGRFVVVFRQAIHRSHPDMVFVDAEGQVLVRDEHGGLGFVDDHNTWVARGDDAAPVVDGTLLVDRFALVDGALESATEIRYQRSRNRSRPETSTDTLGAKDLDGRPFHEPTHELAFVRGLTRGRFAALLVPTQAANTQRWQIVAHDEPTGRLDAFNIERAADGLFSTRGSPTYTCPEHPGVFALAPGECSEWVRDAAEPATTCGRAFIQRVDTSGYAESALRFGADVALAPDEPTGVDLREASDEHLLRGRGELTLEAWIRPAVGAGPPVQVLVGGSAALTADAGLWLWIVEGTKLRVGFGDGRRWNQFTTPPVLDPAGWQHVAIALAARQSGYRLAWTVDGRQRGHTDSAFVDAAETSLHELRGGPATAHPIDWIGGPHAGFVGTIDEMRLWQRARSEDELREDMNHRLTGLEPGLAGYWRFDEATSDRVRDTSDHGYDGRILRATWTPSDAPIGDHPGLLRDSVRFMDAVDDTPLQIAGPPSALLYFQQALAAQGYSGTDKPMKRAGRVMITVPVRRADGDTLTRVAVLDVGVAPTGRLAQLPDVAPLTSISSDTPPLPLVAIDGDGLTTAGGLLEFACAPDGAFLLDGADGKIGLYFAAEGTDRFTVANFDTLVRGAQIELTDDLGREAVRCEGLTGACVTGLSVDVTSAIGTTCALTISTAGLDERWTGVPRQPSELVAILNGDGPVPPGVGRTLTARTPVDGRAPAILVPTDAAPARSLLVAAAGVPRASHLVGSGPVENQLRTSGGADTAGGWTASSNGVALRVSTSCHATAPEEASADRFDTRDDLTVEAWLRPRLSAGRGVLAARQARPVFRMPSNSMIRVEPAAHLDVIGTITIEAWVRVDRRLGGLHDIVAHGYHRSPDGEVFLRINGMWDLRYEVGSWDGSDHLTSFPVPAEDLGRWVHLAGVHDGTCWRLFRNGTEVSARRDDVGAVSVTGTSWQIGASAVNTDPRWIDGWVDDVRIWSCARTAAQILDHLGAPLEHPESEATLVGNWCAAKGVLDRSRFAARCASVGAATIETQVLGPVYDEREGMSLLRHVSDPAEDGTRCCYELRLEGGREQLATKHQRAVFAFDRSHIQIDPSPRLNAAGAITLEAWVKVDRPVSGVQNIVAHGLQGGDANEVFLRYRGMTYEVGSWNGTEHMASWPVPAGDLGRWVHLAGVHDGSQWRLYCDGVEVAVTSDAVGAVSVDGRRWNIGASTEGRDPRYLTAWVDDVRIWSTARTSDQIRQHLGAPIAKPPSEPSLEGNWCAGDKGADRSANCTPSRTMGRVSYPTAELPDVFAPEARVRPVAHVNGLRVRSRAEVTRWTHLAATYRQSAAILLTGDEFLDCPDDQQLDLADDLTIEVFAQIDELDGGSGVLVKGIPGQDTDDHVPYSLAVDHSGRLQFSFEDVDGNVHTFGANNPIQGGSPFRAAVSRRRVVDTIGQGDQMRSATRYQIDINVQDQHGSTVTTTQWYAHPDVAIVNGVATVARKDAPRVLEPTAIGRGSGHLTIGRGYLDLDAARPVSFHGRISQLRIWKTARPGITDRLRPDEPDLVSCWTFDDRVGVVATDHIGGCDARLFGVARWVHDPDPRGSTLRLFVDGIDQSGGVERTAVPVDTMPLALFPRDGTAGDPTDRFSGDVDEIRVWRVARTPSEIRGDMHRRVMGEGADRMIAYYPVDGLGSARGALGPTGDRLHDRSGAGNDLVLVDGERVVSDAPVGDDVPHVANALCPVGPAEVATIHGRPAVIEYGTMEPESGGTLRGALRRCYSILRPGGRWELITGFKVGDLETEWVSQVQSDPQLIGYVEGAPPVPRENLGQRAVPGIGDVDDYNEASAVRIEEADNTRLTYSVDLDHGFDQAYKSSIAAVTSTEAHAGLIWQQKVFETESYVGAQVEFENSYSWLENEATEATDTTSRTTSLELRGRITDDGFLPDNVGLALVRSATADLYALRLRRTGALVGYQLRPNLDVPVDWNVLHFQIDPTYTKQGTLDGFVGLAPDEDYPNAGSARSEASYYKPKEAYRLRRQIVEAERTARLAPLRNADVSPGPSRLSAPDVTRRNLVNTYVWTADGGLFAETQETLDITRDVIGGAWQFKGQAGLKLDVMVASTWGVKFTLETLWGGHSNTVRTRTDESSRAFAVDVTIDKVERDVYQRDPHGKVTDHREPGKVDAYRFMTFYLEPHARNVEEFFERVVDRRWLDGSDPSAVALRCAQRASKTNACWRVFHRVTYVSRVLGGAEARPASLEATLPRLDIDSNYELLRQLGPALSTTVWETTAELRRAVEMALSAAGLDELLGNSAEITEFMEQYLAPATSPVG